MERRASRLIALERTNNCENVSVLTVERWLDRRVQCHLAETLKAIESDAPSDGASLSDFENREASGTRYGLLTLVTNSLGERHLLL